MTQCISLCARSTNDNRIVGHVRYYFKIRYNFYLSEFLRNSYDVFAERQDYVEHSYTVAGLKSLLLISMALMKFIINIIIIIINNKSNNNHKNTILITTTTIIIIIIH